MVQVEVEEKLELPWVVLESPSVESPAGLPVCSGLEIRLLDLLLPHSPALFSPSEAEPQR